MMTFQAAVTVSVVSAIWLLLLILVFANGGRITPFRRNAERGLLVVTAFLAVLWTVIGPPLNLGTTRRMRAADGPSKCMFVREGMTVAKIRELMQTDGRRVAEEDARGPGAYALVYDEQRCIVHLLGDKVVGLEYERPAADPRP